MKTDEELQTSPFDELVYDVRLITRMGFIFGVIAVVAIVILSIFSLKLYADLREIVRENEQRAMLANEEEVSSCFSRAASGPLLRRILVGIEGTLKDPSARNDVRNWIAFSAQTTPTLRDCRQLAIKLNVANAGANPTG